MKFFSKFFKRFSTTLTDANKGENKLEDIIPELKEVKNKIRNKESNLSFADLNILLKYLFKQESLRSAGFKFTKDFRNSVFSIVNIEIIYNEKTDDVEEVFLILKEDIYGSTLRLVVPLSEFRLFLEEFNFKNIANLKI